MYASAILLAAGEGLRFASRKPKLLAEISSKPIIIYSLEALSKRPAIKKIIVVANPDNLPGIKSRIRKYRIKKVACVIYGGRRRQDSVASGLRALDKRTDLVLIHDAARPFIDKGIIERALKEAQKSGAAIAGVPVKATIKEIRGKSRVKRTLNRENLREIQTPQAFKKKLILEAFKKFGSKNVTDDAMLVEKLGRRVSIVAGSYVNIKITTPEDLVIAEAIHGK